ncbi:hypothetical protein SAMN05443665_101311 [Actinomadura meyerae]|uniref:Uncharacterized protein n=1 Tax=Actinomadura meyerae TaxID=240840 RepID=A0A239IPS3_9ACTN|nr:hypothetical protein [Actinomadura meyerae]SNS95561.1 hypothetical protein SAMN05443665_101311 [Actinomadura meyerae]
MTARIAVWAAYAAGLALIGFGASGIAADVPAGRWAAWFAGAAVLHDGVLVPLVLAAGLATARLPDAARPAVRAALVVAGCVTAVALPAVLGFGRRADEPSRLPLPYGRNLGLVLAAIAVIAAAAIAVRLARRRRGARSTARRGGRR